MRDSKITWRILKSIAHCQAACSNDVSIDAIRALADSYSSNTLARWVYNHHPLISDFPLLVSVWALQEPQEPITIPFGIIKGPDFFFGGINRFDLPVLDPEMVWMPTPLGTVAIKGVAGATTSSTGLVLPRTTEVGASGSTEQRY